MNKEKQMGREIFEEVRGTARIEFDGRSFVVPVHSAYDVDMLIEHSRYLATRHNGVQVSVGERVFQVAPTQD
ncbi:MAG TPA: hypothetical protein VEB21_08655 [Terriglobales bacterium]|nr:hypothetical protein [Terriglobales bacterium]